MSRPSHFHGNPRRNALLEAQRQSMRRGENAFWAFATVCAMLAVGCLGLLAWAVIELVSWITTK